MSYPPDDVMVELGKVTFSAIELERAVYRVCYVVHSHGKENEEGWPSARIDRVVEGSG